MKPVIPHLVTWALGGSFCLCVEAGWLRQTPASKIEQALPIQLEAAKDGWELSPDIGVVRDEILGTDVFERSGGGYGWIRSRAPLPDGEYEVVVRARIVDTRAQGLTLHVGASGPAAVPDSVCSISAYPLPAHSERTLRIYPAFGTPASQGYLGRGGLVRGQMGRVRAPREGIWFVERFRNISPVMDASLREELEAAMARLPLLKDTWFELRVVVGADAIQMYRDGFLVGEREPGGRIEGGLQVQLSAHVRVASLEVRRRGVRPAGFYPVGIESQCNARFDWTREPLPAGREGTINGIPFVFPRPVGGNDYVDLSDSLFHYRNAEGHFDALETWPAPQILDPNRIRFSVPNRPWSRLWVVAAFDGQPHRVPVLTARFYRPSAGFPVDATVNIPSLDARRGEKGMTPLPVRLADGRTGNLWLVPIKLDSVKIASEFRNEDFLSLELTKEVFPYRTYPDPANYSWFQGGMPSGVRVFAMTLEEAPLRLIASGNRWGNTYVAPETPVWRVSLQNRRPRKADARVGVTLVDPMQQTNRYHRTLTLGAGAAVETEIPLSTKLFGLHQVRTDVEYREGSGRPPTFTQVGTLVQLPPDTRKTGRHHSRWGLWNWIGAHGTNPNPEENLYLNVAIGSRFCGVRDPHLRAQWGVNMAPQHVLYGPEKWAEKDPYDPAEYQAFSDKIGRDVAARLEKDPDIPSFSIFTETAITPLLTYGVPPEYLGEPELQLTAEEQARYRAFMVTFKAAVEGIRKHAPKAKIALGWCEPYFAAPFLKEKTPREWFDLIGVDSPQFERMPEMPIREVAPNRMWLLKQALKKYGYENVPIIHTESYYPSSHELALGHRGSADSYVRTAVLSLALGTTTFANCWSLQDCSGYWGSQHYGCIGVVGREPEANPKPALPAFATMTRLLDFETYHGFVPTGSHSAYCVRFHAPGRFVYCLWTIRGSREARLTFAHDGEIVRTDENGNETRLALSDRTAAVTLSPTPIWITTPGQAAVEKIELGTPTYSEAPGPHTRLLDPLHQPWKYDPSDYGSYATNHWGAPRFAGPMRLEIVEAPERKARVWQVTLDKPDKERPLAAWYGVFQPEQPIPIPGRARALGVWANGRSNWGRIVYEIEDARGERWQSVGTRDDWNCDDIHSWSYFNFDGWRYIEFPLPHHEPGDNYRSADTVWWNHNAEGVVDLPVKLTRIIIEQRTHNIYVDQLVEMSDRSVQLAHLMAVYDNPTMMTDAPVKLQRSAAHAIPAPKVNVAALPNPIAALRDKGVAEPPVIARIAPPDHGYDGTRVEVTFQPVEGAKEYRVHVSAHENGAGAQPLGRAEKPVVLVSGLRPEFPLFLFGTVVDKDGRESRPTEAKRVLLRDDFPMK